MNKILQIVLAFTLCLCVGFAFVGCSEKERTTAEIKAEYELMMKEYSTYFDTSSDEFKVEYSTQVEDLITTDSRAKLLTSYFDPIAKASYSFFAQTYQSIRDEKFSTKSRTAIYKKLNKVRSALKEFDNAKQRFQVALDKHPSGQEMDTIEIVDYASFVKSYSDFIEVLVEFGEVEANAFFNDFYKGFYSYDGKLEIESYDLQILLKHKALAIAKESINFEYSKYFDLNSGIFGEKVASGDTTKLCVELNKINALMYKANSKITDVEKLAKFKSLTDKQTFFNAQIDIMNTALNNFDFKKMQNSDDREDVYIDNASVAQQKYYQDIFRIAYDYIPQIVQDYTTVFNVL